MNRFIPILLFLMLLIVTIDASAQCAMCTAVADEAMRNGSAQGAGINKGVLYLFVTPYLLVATIGIYWWRRKLKAEEED
jgi:hypothetical protein